MTRICAGIYHSTHLNQITPLPVISTRLRTEIVDLTATHTLTQIFCNPIERATQQAISINEAKYTFPLYESCAVTSFTAQIGTKLIRGVVKPKDEAKAIYDSAKAAGKQAALLEQNTGEVFTTTVGNIPAGAFVIVCIKYVHELKQDIEAEGVRLVVPTVIAPKYGWISPSSDLYAVDWANNWNAMSPELERACAGRPETHGISMEVLATMNGSIRGIQSPSHPISVDIGTHGSSAEFNPQKARATLALSSASLTGLNEDFTLIINSTEIGNPRAFLAPHPDRPGTSTLMVTLVPKFALPQQHPEIVFVVDRSGSMEGNIKTVKSALHLFLASLPVGAHFNICSFGNHASFLWETSQEYNSETLAEAKRHVDTIKADFGGTEMLEPMEKTVNRRRKDLHTEVLVLTDGEIWHTETLFSYISTAAADGSIRFFSLGIGESVSHLLVEGISRAGKGYSQLVGSGEKMQKKLMRMLKAALTPHVNDWHVEWEGKSEQLAAFTETQTEPDSKPPIVQPTISLFDPNTPNDDTISSALRPLPPVSLPPILQAPSSIPPLFPYTRTTVYFHLTTPPPTTISLLGSAHTDTNTLHPLQLNIPITPITSHTTSLGLHSLLGRKLLQDIEEGRCTYLRTPADKPSLASSQRTREGTRIGVEFGLASKWTSFVAVSADSNTAEPPTAEPHPVEARPTSSFSVRRGRTKQTARMSTGGASTSRSMPVAVRAKQMAQMSTSGGAPTLSSMPVAAPTVRHSMKMRSGGPVPLAPHTEPGMKRRKQESRSMILEASCREATEPDEAMLDTMEMEEDDQDEGFLIDEGLVEDGGDKISRLSRLQLFSGHFNSSPQLLRALGILRESAEEAQKRLGIVGDAKKESAFATVLVLAYLRTRLGELEEEWDLMAEKARACLSADIEAGELQRMEAEAETLVKVQLSS